MPNLIILRLHPVEPVDGTEFRSYLQDLEIEVFDLSFGDSAAGVSLGKAEGLADPHLGDPGDHSFDPTLTTIVQHYANQPPPPFPPAFRELRAAATAFVVVNPPAGHPEYPAGASFDLRVEIRRNGNELVYRTRHYNVQTESVAGALPTNQTFFQALDAAAYISLPPASVGLDPNLAHVDVPEDGQPPRFDDLVKAIDLVLAKDPGGANATLKDRAPLTAAQSRQVASEIVWNRTLYPPPQPPRPLGELYTTPGADTDDVERDRMEFEAKLAAYQAMHEAEALRLAGFVFAASAAVVCEKMSAAATRAGLQFPILLAGEARARPRVTLTQGGPLNPSFMVPAAYFYALGAMLPVIVTPEQRYELARLSEDERLVAELQVAIDAGVISAPATTVTLAVPPPPIHTAQAARRLVALGTAKGGAPELPLAGSLVPLVTHWLAHNGPTSAIDTGFWAPEANALPGQYLDLVLQVITADHAPLIAAIKAAPLNVANVAALAAVTDQEWRGLFLGPPAQTALLPDFTKPGSAKERTEAFLRHLKKFFVVPVVAPPATATQVNGPPALGAVPGDVLAAFEAAYAALAGAPFTFGGAIDTVALAAAIQQVLPGDREAEAWLAQVLQTVHALFGMTAGVGPAELQLSLMEALHARGFTKPQDLDGLSLDDFQDALAGTVAYPYAAAIYANAGAAPPNPAPVPGSFQPVNPDGSLTDCIPPEHLSPFGPVAYLAEMLKVAEASTCEQPFPQQGASLADLLAGRRGPLGALHATAANLGTPLPRIDLVNESLEALADGLPGSTAGAVYNTAGDALAGHRLLEAGQSASTSSGAPFLHDPQTLFATVPEHSSPATPVKRPGAYTILRQDFTDPLLPYPQALDVNRSYLRSLGSSRFAAMRTFREDITELATDPAAEPAGFQRHLWRYPARLPIALEYIQISPEEYALLYSQDIATTPAPGALLLREVYGFASDFVQGVPWTDVVVVVPQFLARTGLSYCQLLDLQRSGFVPFVRRGRSPELPDCLPCCPDDLVIGFPPPADPLVALRKLAVFIRLWRRLQEASGPKISMAQLRDICDVLGLFDAADAIRPDFVRQLAALLMLRDEWRLPLSEGKPAAGATGADRTHLLALWVGPGHAKWSWAVRTLLERIDAHAEARNRSLRRPPELTKLLPENLDPLSRLVGFNPDVAADAWHAKPASTLRFVEVLSKLYASGFTTGEVLFLFTPEVHLAGDDPFPMSDSNEALEDPLDLPEDEEEHHLWALRRKLRTIDIGDLEYAEWTWNKIGHALREELGLVVPPGTPDPLDRIGERFFPSVLERAGHPVSVTGRQYRISLAAAATSPLMWNAPPGGPFQYDPAAEELWSAVPLRDDAVVEALQEMRPLTGVEQAAVQDLYFAPRADLARLSLLFEDFTEAAERLTQEPDEGERWRYFQRAFALFYRRCRVIARHLAEHVAAKTGRPLAEEDSAAWMLLRHLFADENFGLAPWEHDSGAPPDVTWGPRPHGGALAALLGLSGAGLLSELRVDQTPVFRDVVGVVGGFGAARNRWNAPVPTVVPGMNLALTPDQLRFVVARNGFALRNKDGEPLGGAQPFTAVWSGVLLVESAGPYRFHAGAPTPEGEAPDFGEAREHRWRLTLKRGQKKWVLLHHRWQGEDAPDARSGALHLKRGAYEIVVELTQQQPSFATAEEVCKRRAGFEIKYQGPDSGDRLIAIPMDKLFQDRKTGRLSAGLRVRGQLASYLDARYTSTLRDIRRTYQRAFKAMLFVHRFGLEARDAAGERESELGYLLEHGSAFLGTSYPRTGLATFGVHHAYLDFNLLPVKDPYFPPAPAQDQREAPGARRQSALFDGWERIRDHAVMRSETRAARERPAWLLFHEASEKQPDDPPQLVRHLGVDILHAPLVLTYWASPVSHTITTPELEDERWAVRVWEGEKWIRRLHGRFFTSAIGAARPELWAADDPGAPHGIPPVDGNSNLTTFVRNGSFENGDPRRYEDVAALNNGLRERARAALVAYLTGMDRVSLPWGGHAKAARDLSDLLLQDVEVGVCQRASRIEEAISAVQKLVQRARLGLEPAFTVTPAFALLWDRRFAGFRVWESCERRWVYRENWITWDEVEKARKTEAFRFLQSELRRATLTVPVPGGLTYWPGERPPAYPGLTLLQAREPSGIRILPPGPEPEGLDLFGTPERDARPSWLAPLFRIRRRPYRGDQSDDGTRLPGRPDNAPVRDQDPTGQRSPEGQTPGRLTSGQALSSGAVTGGGTTATASLASATAVPLRAPARGMPLWIQAAIRLGTRFVRVAAAGIPPASAAFTPRRADTEGVCCTDCGRVHPPAVDEYYFWLQDARSFSSGGEIQDANEGVNGPNATSHWHDPERLPKLLHWESEPMVLLLWCRVHHGEFTQPRRSDEGVRVTPGVTPELDFKGRTGDSLRFEVIGGEAPVGHTDATAPGFRYDLATDSAVTLPLVVAPAGPLPGPFPGGLGMYPYFAYFSPGAPLLPLTMFAEAVTVAGNLRAHCRFEAALKWYSIVLDPLRSDLTWAQCPPGSRGPRRDGDETEVISVAGGPITPEGPEGGRNPAGRRAAEPSLSGGERSAPALVAGSSGQLTGSTEQGTGAAGLVVGTPDPAAVRNPAEGGRVAVPVVARTPDLRAGEVSVVDDHTAAPARSTPDVPSLDHPTLANLSRRGGDLPCCPHAPVPDDVARRRAVTLEYLETLLQWGDALLCRNTPEAFQQATVVFDTLHRALGERPATVLAQDDAVPMELSAFQPRPAPLNPRLVALYDGTADRLTLLRRCDNGRRLRNGRPNLDMPYFGDSALVDGWRSAVDVCEDEADGCLSCCSAYRFTFLVQKALELAGEVRTFGAALLAAYEKGDAEYLASLRATHERQLLHLALELRKDQWREADWQAQALQRAKEGALTRYRYYEELLANGLNAGEIGYRTLMGVSIASRIAGNVLEGIAQGMGVVPDMWLGVAGIMGSPLQFNQLPIGTKLAGAFATAARILNAVADNANAGASLSATEGGWERREREWEHQVEVIGIEIEQIERQILAAERRRDVTLRELSNHRRQMENAMEVQDFLRDKFTSHELYLFLQQETAALLRRTYELALQTARKAQRAFHHERGSTARDFLPKDAWDNLHESLLAGDKLLAAVRQMEKAYLDENCREYELTKHVSLRQCFPEAFLALRLTGYCEIDIPEWMFDLDYPGHYMRRVKSVSVTVPCVAGPYTGVHCRLTLLSSTTRVDPRLTDPPGRCCGDPACSDGYHALPDDPRVRKTYAATEAIATSSGQNDSGLFELSFRDERYLPFELAGAVSRWRIELPQENNQWSLDTLGDFVLHLHYTAREGGDALRRAAGKRAQRHLPGGGVRILDVRHELPDAWHAFQGGGVSRDRLPLRLHRGMFPFVPGRRGVTVDRVSLFFEAKGATPSASHVVELLGGDHGHSHATECDCDRRFVTCVASSEWPEVFHGVVEIDPRRVGEDRPRDFGVLRFPAESGTVESVFLLLRYRVE